MTEATLGRRSFTHGDQQTFARLSSDFNPLHLDAAFARRTQMGSPVVHGIHTLLWTLETLQQSARFDIARIKVRFHQPLFPHETGEIRMSGRTAQAVSLKVVAAGTVVAAIRLFSEPGKTAVARPLAEPLPQPPTEPVDLSFEEMQGRAGAVAVKATDAEIRALFPALAASLGPERIRGLMATSQLVGMACPGLNSLFSGLDVACAPERGTSGALAYAVAAVDARFRSLQIEVAGSGLSGQIDAFARLPPPAQSGMAAVSARVRADAFAGQRVLVVGGSRGLGEVTAKIIAAGGGHPVITYRDGLSEAEAVAASIRAAGGACDVVRYDALEPAAPQLAGIGAVGACYYFATAKIFQRKSALYEAGMLHAFSRYYVDGFHALCAALHQSQGGARLALFYPSTVAIDEATSGLAEYAMAKAAGEVLASYLGVFLPNVTVLSRRLPRVMTDQTSTVGVATAHDALDVLIPIVEELQQLARS
jgi:acyl dehydratase